MIIQHQLTPAQEMRAYLDRQVFRSREELQNTPEFHPTYTAEEMKNAQIQSHMPISQPPMGSPAMPQGAPPATGQLALSQMANLANFGIAPPGAPMTPPPNMPIPTPNMPMSSPTSHNHAGMPSETILKDLLIKHLVEHHPTLETPTKVKSNAEKMKKLHFNTYVKSHLP